MIGPALVRPRVATGLNEDFVTWIRGIDGGLDRRDIDGAVDSDVPGPGKRGACVEKRKERGTDRKAMHRVERNPIHQVWLLDADDFHGGSAWKPL